MQTRRNSLFLPLSSIFASGALCLSAHAQVTNPGFEDDWNGWDATDPSAISDEAQSGSKSAKITGAGGRFEQSISLEANSNYELSAWVEGTGVIGIKDGPSTKTSDEDFSKYTVPFATGSSGDITIYGASGEKGDVRFDTIKVTATGGDAPASEPAASTSSPDASSSSSGDASKRKTEDAKYASDLIDLDCWKLNIPFDSSGNDSGKATDWDDRNKKSHAITELDQYELKENGETFFGLNSDGTAVVFRAHATGATTGGSQYPRTELRQLMNVDGNWKSAYWPGDKYQKMHLKGRITATPSIKPEVIIAQIHAKNSKADDTLKVGYDHDEQVIFVTYVDSDYVEHVTHPLQPSTYSNPGDPNPDVQRLDYTLGDNLEIIVENKRPGRPDYEVYVQVNNLSTGKGITLTYIQGKDDDGYYFKAGCYSQSRYMKDDMFLHPLKSGGKERASAYGETEISALEVTSNL